jgi:hypothetical protein
MSEPRKLSKDPFTGRPQQPRTPAKPWKAPSWIPRWPPVAWLALSLFGSIAIVVVVGNMVELLSGEEESVRAPTTVSTEPFAGRLYVAFATYDDAASTRLCRTRTDAALGVYTQICDTWLDSVEPFVLEEELRHEYMDGFATAVDQLR